MCFRKKEIDYRALRKDLESSTMNKYYDFLDYLKDNEKYNFLTATKWFRDIDEECYYPLSALNYKFWGEIDENCYNSTKETCDKISDVLREAKVSIPDVIAKMRENSENFKNFCKKTFSRFFVLEPLFGGQKLYCFSCHKELFPETLKTDSNGFYYLDIAVMKTTEPTCSVEDIFSTDYEIRSMYEWEFRDIYLPLRCEKSGITSEIELVKYTNELNKLFIEDSITLKEK